MTAQPDFRKLFAEWGAGAAAPLRYVVRGWSNSPHDIAFLSGLVHDAVIRHVSLEASFLTIQMQRDTWEKYSTTRELTDIASELRIGPLRKVRFSSSQNLPIGEGHMILSMRQFPTKYEQEILGIRILGDGFTIDCWLKDDEFQIVLQDAAVGSEAGQ